MTTTSWPLTMTIALGLTSGFAVAALPSIYEDSDGEAMTRPRGGEEPSEEEPLQRSGGSVQGQGAAANCPPEAHPGQPSGCPAPGDSAPALAPASTLTLHPPTKAEPENLGLRWVTIPAGLGTIGDRKWTDSSVPFYIRFHEPFQMLETEVTNRQYAAQNPGHRPIDEKPVANVNWSEARAYCEAIQARLPTEIEWEYAARAGGKGAYGRGQGGVEVNATNLREFAWYSKRGEFDPDAMTHPVKTKKPNAYGLHDVWGNVLEWVLDGYSDQGWAAVSALGHLSLTTGGFVNSIADRAPDLRVLRGGSAWSEPEHLRSGHRRRLTPTFSIEGLGFRCVQAPSAQALNIHH